METFSALLALCAGNSPVTGEFPQQRPVMRNFDVFYLRLNKRLGKQSWGWWFETPSCWWWCHCNGDADVVNKSFQNANVSISTRHYGIMDWGSVLAPKYLSCIFCPNDLKTRLDTHATYNSNTVYMVQFGVVIRSLCSDSPRHNEINSKQQVFRLEN